jgi:membrane-bound lytic murein transglycosylase D
MAGLAVLGLSGIVFAMGWSEPRMLSEPYLSGGEGESTAPPSVVDEDEATEVERSTIAMGDKVPWQEPAFADQTGALGWSPEVFQVPEGMQPRVDFWRRIYTEFSTDEGVLHDSEHVGVVFEAIDFKPIMRNPALSDREKSRARRQLVDERKKAIRESLQRLAKMKTVEGLSAEDIRIFNLYSKIDEPNKFQASMHRKRLRFQLGQKDRFLQGIYYSGRYLRDMERVFREQGLPIELTRLPFVESSFNVKARSRVGASGIWQFMRYTGRRFMRINGVVDERNDPLRATEAAARLFKINYGMLGLWPLAVTGYNHGPSGVQRVVKKFNTNSIAELVDERHGRFGFASANFYACFLAALDAEKNARKYFGNELYWDSLSDAREIRPSRAVGKKLLLKWFNENQQLAQDLNPHIQKTFWMGYAQLSEKDFLRVPAHVFEVAMADLKALPQRGLAQINAGDAEAGLQNYVVGQGETLSEIAAQFGVSLMALKELNGIESPRQIRAGQKLILPEKSKR